jgi:putative restriction endonuclease
LSVTAEDVDARVRAAAFAYLGEQRLLHGDVMPRDVLARGFSFEGTRIPLVGPQGIFKPAILQDAPLSITTSPPVLGKPAPYADEVGDDGLLRYRYRGTNPDHHENRGLRTAMMRRLPLVYFFGIVPGRYLPVWPAYIVGDDPGTLSFSVAVDDRIAMPVLGDRVSESHEDARRRYVTAAVQVRLHQQSFRERVVDAYQRHCAVCRLRHVLEAAHILPDGHPQGLPIVPNGLALCSLHHAAFDAHILGVRPDCVIELRHDILEEADGPMLQHGLQGFHGQPLVVPRADALKPRREFLEERYATFKKAG